MGTGVCVPVGEGEGVGIDRSIEKDALLWQRV